MAIDNRNTPAWIQSKLFENILRESVEDFKEISSFIVYPALAPGENYATTMLKVQLEVKLTNDSQDALTLMLKVPNKNEHMQDQWNAWKLFETESRMYRQTLPALEKLYADAGVEVIFGAKAYSLNVDERHVLLEDLARRGFKTLKRQNGLDMEHCKSVLRKMAQWHAASAVVMKPGESQSIKGILNGRVKDLLDKMFNDALKSTLHAVKKLPHHEEYYDKLRNLSSDLGEKLRTYCQVDKDEFNVLNHGDCWSNNIMFQYDEEGRLQETYFVDLQVPLYGSPAMDLYYFIFSSARLDLKISRFDEMIKFYHDNLIENLTLLKYKGTLPTLRCIQKMLFKYGIWGIFTTCTIMAGALCPPTNLANIDHLVGETDDAEKFKALMFLNDSYLEHLKIILPWLNARGAFDY